MKKTIFILAAILYSSFGQAQTTAIKFNTLGLIVGNASFMGEYAISNKFSVAAGVSVMALKKQIEVPEDFQQLVDNADGTAYTAEIRWYPAEVTGVMRNFYAAPYFRYANYNTSYEGSVNVEDIGDIDFVASGKINEIGAGLQLGYQWVIKNRVVVDWFFLGPRISKYSADAKAVGPETEAEFYAVIPMDELVDSGYLDTDDVSIEVSGNTATSSASTILPALRTGFSIGICF